ncbi:MAG: T9SS type A sorting domain-containing protein [Ignavibacteria bacterium]|nr:T9SS type A sorting domain-containing protein [Ignavibacteria bacterium]
MKTEATSKKIFKILILGLFFLTGVSYSQIMFGSDSIMTQPTATYFDFSAGHGSNDSTGTNFLADFRGTSNEGTNFGAENTQIPGNRYLRFSTNGNLDTVTTVPLCTNTAPWVSVSWDWPNGTSGYPVKAGELWVVYTREGHYACMQITYADTSSDGTPGFGNYFKFNYKYQPNGSNDITGVIPVELTSFTASTIGNYVELKWSTATETNNKGFEIERASLNNFKSVGFIEGNATSTTPQSYSFTDENLSAGKYNYRIKQIDFDGTFKYFNLSEVVEVGAPDNFSLSQNYPNPFNPNTIISWQLPVKSYVTLRVYDVLGKEVALLVNEEQEAGSYKVDFSSSNLAGGIYFYSLQVGQFVQTKKMVILK